MLKLTEVEKELKDVLAINSYFAVTDQQINAQFSTIVNYACKYLFKKYGYTLDKIGTIINRDHSSVNHHLKHAKEHESMNFIQGTFHEIIATQIYPIEKRNKRISANGEIGHTTKYEFVEKQQFIIYLAKKFEKQIRDKKIKTNV